MNTKLRVIMRFDTLEESGSFVALHLLRIVQEAFEIVLLLLESAHQIAHVFGVEHLSGNDTML